VARLRNVLVGLARICARYGSDSTLLHPLLTCAALRLRLCAERPGEQDMSDTRALLRDEGQGHDHDTAHADPAMRRQVAPDEDHESETREEPARLVPPAGAGETNADPRCAPLRAAHVAQCVVSWGGLFLTRVCQIV